MPSNKILKPRHSAGLFYSREIADLPFMNPVIYADGQFVPAETALFGARSRALRYGLGLFETLKVRQGRIINLAAHWQRITNGLGSLNFQIPEEFQPGRLEKVILDLCSRNDHLKAARLRLAVYANHNDAKPDHYLPALVIESELLPESCFHFNKEGFSIGLYPDVRKSCDFLANLKSANYLPCLLAAQYARMNGWHDALILNQHERICESSIANLFWIRKAAIFTPPLSEGPIAGTMRLSVLQVLKAEGYAIMESPCSVQELYEADEIFLTNALTGIRWVKHFQGKEYNRQMAHGIYSILEKNGFI